MSHGSFNAAPFLLLIILIPVIFFLVYVWEQNLRQGMKELGEKLGLEFSEDKGSLGWLDQIGRDFDPWKLTGMHESVPVRITTVHRGAGKSRRRHTQIKAFFQTPAGCELRAKPEGLLSRLGKDFLSMRDIEFGDEPFDKAFIVNAKDESRAKGFLTAELRGALVDLVTRLSEITVEDDGVAFETEGNLRDANRCREVLDALSAAAKKSPGSF